MGNNAGIVIEILYYLVNMNLLALYADITKTNESMNSVKLKKNYINFINRLNYAGQ